jgi:hypothetical protein
MVMIEIDQLPGYPTKRDVPFVMDEFGNLIDGPLSYPIPDFHIVDDKQISIIDKVYHQLDHKLEMKLIQFLYGPSIISKRIEMGVSTPRIFLKGPFRNNWIRCLQYGQPITAFTPDISGIQTSVSNQLVFKQTSVVDIQHPYFQKISEMNKIVDVGTWPWVTLEMSILEIRPGDLILNQIQLYEIDLDMRYYLEVDDITSLTAYQLTS